jgi:probable HAF family extracellular repeat protein
MRRTLTGVLCSVAVWGVVAPPAAATAGPAPRYLGTYGGFADFVTDLNDADVLVGTAQRAGHRGVPVRWDATGRIHELAPWGRETTPVAINDTGVVVGHTTVGDFRTHAVRWTGDRDVADLGTVPGYPDMWAVAVNDTGVIIGRAANGSRFLPVRWSPAGRMTGLPLPPRTDAGEALDLNESGVAVGYVSGTGPGRPVRWDRAGRVTRLAMPGQRLDHTAARSINDAGVVVGSGITPDGVDRVLRWDPAGRLAVLPTLPGTRWTEPLDIGRDGTVIGRSWTPSGIHPVKWGPDGRIVDLGTLPGGTAGDAADIAPDGTVIGTSTQPGDVQHGVLWRPCGPAVDLGPVGEPFSPVGPLVINRRHTIGGAVRTATGGYRAVVWNDPVPASP